MKELIEKINKLKKEKNAVILAHCYQNVEIDEVADYVGDSLYLSQMAAKTDADIILFAGVYFMAQTAKILCPDIPTVCYINSTAEVKSECDICCTSSNAVKIVGSLNADKVLFLPDTYLGKWVEAQLGNLDVITYPGFCPTHLQIRPEDITAAREKYPDAPVLAHPECHQSVTKLADYVGSTTGIMKYAVESDKKRFIIATEKGVADRLKRDYPDKEFILIKENIICPNMKWHNLIDIYSALEKEEHEIIVDKEIAAKALNCIDRMLDVSAAGAK